MFTEVTSDNVKEQVLFILNNNWNNNYTGFSFPLPSSVNIKRENLIEMKNGNYVFTKKDVNSRRAVFMLYEDQESNNKQYLILKDSTVLETNFTISDYYFKGSIFDVSFIDDTLTVYDAFMIGGYKVNNMNHLNRFSMARNFTNGIEKINSAIFYENLNEISVKENEELYLIPVEDQLLSGVNFHSFKWRPANLIDFGLLCEEMENEIWLYITNFKKNILFSKIKGEYTNCIKKLENYKNGCVVNAKFVDKEIEFISISDKQYPSNLRQVENALFVQNENITFHDLIS